MFGRQEHGPGHRPRSRGLHDGGERGGQPSLPDYLRWPGHCPDCAERAIRRPGNGWGSARNRDGLCRRDGERRRRHHELLRGVDPRRYRGDGPQLANCRELPGLLLRLRLCGERRQRAGTGSALRPIRHRHKLQRDRDFLRARYAAEQHHLRRVVHTRCNDRDSLEPSWSPERVDDWRGDALSARQHDVADLGLSTVRGPSIDRWHGRVAGHRVRSEHNRHVVRLAVVRWYRRLQPRDGNGTPFWVSRSKPRQRLRPDLREPRGAPRAAHASTNRQARLRRLHSWRNDGGHMHDGHLFGGLRKPRKHERISHFPSHHQTN